MIPFVKGKMTCSLNTNHTMTSPFGIITALFIMLILGIALVDALTYNYKKRK